MEAHGRLTARLAEELRKEYGDKGFDVFHDHRGDVEEDPEHAGKIVSWFEGEKGLGRETELSQLDIAIVGQASGRTIALIEIEESNDKPKTLLGDAMGALMGEEFQFKGQQLRTGNWTTLIILARGSDAHAERNDFLNRQIAAARSELKTGNSNIGNVIIQGLSSEADLWPKVKEQMEAARQRAASMVS